MNVGDLNKVWEVKPLKRKPKEDEARKILERIAQQVQPIMQKRKWRVKLLSEFCPSNQRLLGLNVGGGVHVKLRLRRPNNDLDFYPYNEVLDTMLHELCHNKYGPHNATFYNLWDELRKECEELISKGITGTGEGFDLPGKRLGGLSRQPPLSSLRKTALAAAENRSRIQLLLPSGPKRLGGDTFIMTALTPIQAAAMAAERRVQDDIWCGSHSLENVVEEECSSKTRKSSVKERDVHSSKNRPLKRSRDLNHQTSGSDAALGIKNLSNGLSISCSGKNQDRSAHRSVYAAAQTSECETDVTYTGTKVNKSATAPTCCPTTSQGKEATRFSLWECGLCTFLNPPLALVCKICLAEKPRDVIMKYKTWACKLCTLENSVDFEKCSACEQWRYSYGPPVSSPSPHLGT
uniref:Uncharacterized protein n=1 Tax=Kalanchoe fedtschenkoi TaxID=63787 RepID=A0A7N0U2Y2_KALFE